MTDDKLRALWGDDLFNYCFQKSMELIGYPNYATMMMVAIGQIKDHVNLNLGASLGTLGG